MWSRRPSRPRRSAAAPSRQKPAPRRGRVAAAFDLLHKLVTGGAALATLVKLLLG